MSRIQIDNITIRNCKAALKEGVDFRITFTALEGLLHSLVWKVIYVGSAFTEDYDQVLEEF
jgi:histone chaperone ASF1